MNHRWSFSSSAVNYFTVIKGVLGVWSRCSLELSGLLRCPYHRRLDVGRFLRSFCWGVCVNQPYLVVAPPSRLLANIMTRLCWSLPRLFWVATIR